MTLGHLLGLAHSNDHRSAMFPQNKKFDLKYGLSDDDVRGIRRLYPPSKQPQRLPTKPLNDNSV
jgi:predicted Zn-dependent protease